MPLILCLVKPHIVDADSIAAVGIDAEERLFMSPMPRRKSAEAAGETFPKAKHISKTNSGHEIHKQQRNW